MRHFNIYGFITIYGILFLVILYKVLHVPVTTDEVPTAFFYSNFSVWKIMMFPDNWPNNHILNTILAKFSILIFGKEQWTVRLPNLLFFMLFAFGVWRILKLDLKPDSVYFLPAALLFVNPYLLDFFGLCRGYGISSTLVTISALLLLVGFKKRKDSFMWLSLLTSILASYANFTVLVFWASDVLLVWLYFLIKNEYQLKKMVVPTLVIFFISIAYLALIMVPIQKMQSTDQFKYWSSNGFYDDTIISLIHEWKYNSVILSKISSHFIFGIFAAIFLFNTSFLFLHVRKKRFSPESFSHPVVVATLLLLLPAGINLLQTLILGTPNLRGRTALFFYPLIAIYIVVMVSLIPKFKKRRVNKAVAIAVLLVFVMNLSHRISLKSVREWAYDQDTLRVINYLKGKYDGTPVSLKTNWIFHPSFYFYSDSGKIPWIDLRYYDYNIDINTTAEYYYIFASDYQLLAPRFDVVYKFSPERWLLKKKSF